MRSHQCAQMERLHTKAWRMEIILLKSAPDIKDLAVPPITGLLVKKPYLIPYACYQLIITYGIWPLLIADVLLMNYVMCLWHEKS